MKFKVDRSKWRCGGYGPYKHGEGDTELLNSKGFMCCLGFCSNQMKIPKKTLKGKEIPSQLEKVNILCEQIKHEDYSYYINTELSNCAMSANDEDSISREDREESLAKLFAEHGHELTFTGKYTDEL